MRCGVACWKRQDELKQVPTLQSICLVEEDALVIITNH